MFAVAGGAVFLSLSPLFYSLLCFFFFFALSPFSSVFFSPFLPSLPPLFIEPVSMFFSLWSQGTGHAAAGQARLSRRASLGFGDAVGGRLMSSVGGLEGPAVGGLEGPASLNMHSFSFFPAVCSVGKKGEQCRFKTTLFSISFFLINNFFFFCWGPKNGLQHLQ